MVELLACGIPDSILHLENDKSDTLKGNAGFK